MVKSAVNKSVVRAIANIAILFLVRLERKLRFESVRIIFLLGTLYMAPTYNLSILNTDNPVSHLSNLLIVGNHHHCLSEFFTGHF